MGNGGFLEAELKPLKHSWRLARDSAKRKQEWMLRSKEFSEWNIKYMKILFV
jgi:hypothetical protein